MNRHFQLFGLPEQFDIDSAALDQTYRALAAQFHPDKTAAASAFEQRQAVMVASALNEAYRVLNNPIDRAASLLMDKGIDADAPEHTAFSPEFLMQQMQWRETLAEARADGNAAALAEVAAEASEARRQLLSDLHDAFERQDGETAAQLVRQGRFLDKLVRESTA